MSIEFTSDPDVGADTKSASANKSTSSGLLFPLELCVGPDVGTSKRSPIKLCPNKSTCGVLPLGASAKNPNNKSVNYPKV